MLNNEEQQSDLIAFRTFISRHLRQLIVYSTAGGLVAFCITFFIPKEYVSYGLVYPPSSTSVDNSIDYPNFGYDVEADRLMQILEAGEIRDSVIRKFDLLTYFEIDTDRVDWHDELLKKYYKNINMERTNSMAVLIKARSRDPQMSAAIINYLIGSADRFREKLYKRNIVPAYQQALAEYNYQKKICDSLESRLQQHLSDKKLSSLLVLMSDAQISMDLDKLSSSNGYEGIGEDIMNFKSQYEMMREAKTRMLKARKTMINPIPGIYVINYGEPNYKKVYPSYFVNAGLGAVMALAVTLVILLINSRGATAKP